jgi:hypothetical protein
MGIETDNESVGEYRARISKMGDARLISQGQAARYMFNETTVTFRAHNRRV